MVFAVLNGVRGCFVAPWPLALAGVALAVYAVYAGERMRRDRVYADVGIRIASGLSALLPFLIVSAPVFAGIYAYFARPWVVRSFGHRLDPVSGEAHRGLLGALALALGGVIAVYVGVVPGALDAAQRWGDTPEEWFAVASQVWGFLRTQALWALPGLLAGLWVLGFWGRSSRAGFLTTSILSLALVLGTGVPSILAAARYERDIRIAEGLTRESEPATLVRALSRPDVKGRIAAARLLAASGRRSLMAIPALTQALQDPERRVRLHAAVTLAKFAPETPALTEILVEAFESGGSRPDEEASVLGAFGNLGARARGALPLLGKALERSDAAARALADLGAAAVPLLAESLQHEAAAVRRRAATGLRRLGPAARSAAPGIEAALKDADPGVRAEAALALGEILREKALPQLTALLGGDRIVAAAAATALCALGHREGLAALEPGSNALNAMRNPAVWDHLKRTPLDRDLDGTLGEVLEELAVHAVSCVEVEGEGPGALESFRRVHAESRRRSTLEVLLALDVPFVLENDRIRIFSPAEARRFWNAWLLEARHPAR